MATAHGKSVEKYIRKSSFHDDVHASFVNFVFQERNAKFAFWFVAACLLITRSLQTTSLAACGLVVGLSLFYCLWYSVTHLFLYVIIWIQKFFSRIFQDQ